MDSGALKGCFPQASSYMSTPKEKMSVRKSTFEQRICSGDA